MADRPINFRAPMINALLAGRKSMTRRILKPKWIDGANRDFTGWHPERAAEQRWQLVGGMGIGATMAVPYAVGDRLWVREGFAYGWPVEGNHQLPECNQEHAITYRADGNQPFGSRRWKSSIHMPRWASRLTLTVADVRVERLQEITEEDARAEGVCETAFWERAEHKVSAGAPWSVDRLAFADLWTSIHGPEAWAANQWVAALTFTVHRCNIDQMPGGNHE